MIDWILENWVNIAAAWGMLVALCTIIVKATPTQKDDNVLAKVVKWADVFSVVFTKEDAETIAKALKEKGEIMATKHQVKKTFLKTWCIANYYNYQIWEVDAGGEKWLEATPITKGVTRTAENEKVFTHFVRERCDQHNKVLAKR